MTLDEMRIQRKPRSSLLDLIESQLGKDAPGKVAQSKLPTPLPTLPFQPIDLKIKREPKARRWWELEKPTLPKRTRLREWLSKPR